MANSVALAPPVIGPLGVENWTVPRNPVAAVACPPAPSTAMQLRISIAAENSAPTRATLRARRRNLGMKRIFVTSSVMWFPRESAARGQRRDHQPPVIDAQAK